MTEANFNENIKTTNVKKIAVVGNANCGKTYLIRAFIEVVDSEASAQNFHSIARSNIEIDGTNFTLLICEAPSLQDYKGERSEIYEDADVAIICFAVDSMTSLLCVTNTWLREILENRPNLPLVLVGNKCDLRSQDVAPSTVSYNNGLLTASNINAFQYLECSANTKERILEVFIAAVKATLK